MAVELVTDVSAELILLADAKTHLRVTATDEDTLIEALITTARQWVENYTRRALGTQMWNLWLDDFPAPDGSEKKLFQNQRMAPLLPLNVSRFSVFEIPKPPLQTISFVKYFNEDQNAWVTLTNGVDYQFETASERGRIAPYYGTAWPVPKAMLNAVQIQFVCGYDTVANTPQLPNPLRQAMMLLIGAWYQYREAIIKLDRGKIDALPVPASVPFVLDMYRSWRAY